jgi:hypothetical protein
MLVAQFDMPVLQQREGGYFTLCRNGLPVMVTEEVTLSDEDFAQLWNDRVPELSEEQFEGAINALFI